MNENHASICTVTHLPPQRRWVMLVNPCGRLSPTQPPGFQESRAFSRVMDTWEGKLQTSPPPFLPGLYAEHDITYSGISLWAVGLSFPSCAPPQFLVHSQPPGWWGGGEVEQAALCKHCSEITNTGLYYQHCFQHKSKDTALYQLL